MESRMGTVQSTCSWTCEWIIKIGNKHKMEYNSALKITEITKFVRKCVNFKCVLLTEITQSQKENNCMLSLHEMLNQTIKWLLITFICKCFWRKIYKVIRSSAFNVWLFLLPFFFLFVTIFCNLKLHSHETSLFTVLRHQRNVCRLLF